MTMHHSSRSSEINYWPSISDMFLVFFVIALCAYSLSNANVHNFQQQLALQSNGDMLENKLLIRECAYFLSFYGLEYDDASRRADEKQEAARPELAALLYKGYQLEAGEPKGEAPSDFHTAIDHLFSYFQSKHQLPPTPSDSDFDHMRSINYFLGQRSNQKSLKEMDEKQKEISNLRNYINALNQLNSTLMKRNTDLKDIVSKLQDDSRKQNETHRRENANLQGEINKLKKKNADLEASVSKLQDDSREQIVALDEKKVKFTKNGTSFENEDEAEQHISNDVIKPLLDMANKKGRTYKALVVEIIGHTDASIPGVLDQLIDDDRVEIDNCNPLLGLQRAIAIKDFIINSLNKAAPSSSYTIKGRGCPIYFKCYSASWLTPAEFSRHIESADAEEKHRVYSEKDRGAADRRVEVYIRPLFREDEQPQ